MQIPLFTEEQLPEPKKKPKPKKKNKEPALLQGKAYQQMPPPPEHKHVKSINPNNELGWTPEDWRLHMDRQHPNINYEHN